MFGDTKRVVAVIVAAVVFTATMGTGALASGKPKRHPIPAASAFILPSTKVCVSGRRLTFRLRVLPHVRWRTVTVSVNGRRVKTIQLSRIPQPVRISGLPAGKLILRITARTSDGRSVTATRTYRACGPKPAHRLTVALAGTGSGTVKGAGIACPGTCSKSYSAGSTVTLTATPKSGSSFSSWSGGGCSGTKACTLKMGSDRSVTATFAANPPAAPPPGSYFGSTSQVQNTLSLFVSPDGTRVQDVTIGIVDLSCTPVTPTPNPSPDRSLTIASIPINPDRSFSTTTTEIGVIGNAPVHITYTFSGQFQGASVAGLVREDVTYDGTSTSCTSNNQSWSATREAQGNQAALAPPAGSYFGSTSQVQNTLSLFVSPDSTQVQDVTIGIVVLACTPAAPTPNPSPDRSLTIASIPINPDGSFSTTTTETGVIGNAPVHITYTFSGHFHGRNTSNNERAAGTVRENLTYDGTSTSCTSNNQSWSATWQSQGNQAPLAPPAGSYAGSTSQVQNTLAFSVSSNSTHLQNVTIGIVDLACTPATPTPNPSPDRSFTIPSIPINTDESFSGTTTQAGVEGGAPVHITYTFSGHFHGTDASNRERVAGSVREDITYDGTSTTCTSNNQAWFATHQ
jgi:hypothetical protein